MNIKLERDFNHNLGFTAVENIFIDSFMPSADGNFVKIYILALRRAWEGREVSNEIIADLLGIIESDVVRAWDYWQDMGIVRIEKDEVEFLDLKKLFIENVYYPKTESKDSIVETMTSPIIAEMLSKAEFFMRKSISPMQKQDIAKWIEIYNMPPQIILEAFKYAGERKNVYRLNYVEKIVRDWSDKNIRTIEQVEESFRLHDEKYYRYNEVMRTIGLNQKPYNDMDFEMINKWFDIYGFSMDVVKEALKKVVNIQNPNLSYFDKILTSWHKKGVTKVRDIELLDTKPEPKKRPTKFHNFEGHTDTLTTAEMEEMAKKKREAQLRELEEDNEQ